MAKYFTKSNLGEIIYFCSQFEGIISHVRESMAVRGEVAVAGAETTGHIAPVFRKQTREEHQCLDNFLLLSLLAQSQYPGWVLSP